MSNNTIQSIDTRRALLIACFITIALVTTCFQVIAQTAGKENYNVAIFLYDGVELLDFGGPGEVFSAAGFNTYTMSFSGNEVVSQGFVTIKPQYSILNAPEPDIVVFPGGGAGATSNNQQVLEWIKTKVAQGAIGMSVCTGARVLANAGLLKGLNATTWYGFIPTLRADHPEINVLEHTRFVDSGNIITTAGVSAGIDGALHVVARIKGLDVALATARYMEYDKWKPEEGKIDFKNKYIEQIAAEMGSLSKERKAIALNQLQKPYLGEFKNLAMQFKEKQKFNEEARVLELALEIYPTSTDCANELVLAYAKLGKAAPLDQESFIKLLTDGKLEAAKSRYQADRKMFPTLVTVDEQTINGTGYKLLRQKEFDKAIKVFELNTQLFPESANAFDSLAEGYLTSGNKKEATTYYRKSLEMNPANENAKRQLTKIESLK